MIHCRPTGGWPLEDDAAGAGLICYRERFTAVEASTSAVRKAKRAADESLRRAQDAPEPHVTTNTTFLALWEAHLRDRETLFAAMRQLEDARAALRKIAAEFAGTGGSAAPAGLRRAG